MSWVVSPLIEQHFLLTIFEIISENIISMLLSSLYFWNSSNFKRWFYPSFSKDLSRFFILAIGIFFLVVDPILTKLFDSLLDLNRWKLFFYSNSWKVTVLFLFIAYWWGSFKFFFDKDLLVWKVDEECISLFWAGFKLKMA